MSDSEKPQGFLRKASRWVKDANDEARSRAAEAKDAEALFYAQAEEKYGRLVESGQFDGRRIELFDGGFVRVGGYQNVKNGPSPSMPGIAVAAYTTPFERLRAIKLTTQVQDKSAGGRAVASAASLGLSNLASNEMRVLFLAISTDQQTHALKERVGMLRGADQSAMKLELAGRGILEALAVNPSGSVRVESGLAPAPAASVADELSKFAALRNAGVLTEDEFAAQKAKLLGL